MSGIVNKIKDAVTGHHTTNTTNTTTTTHGAHTTAPLANTTAAHAPLTGSHTAVGATPLGSAQVKDVPLNSTTGLHATHGTATGALAGATAGHAAGHGATGALAGAALGHHAAKDSHLHSSSTASHIGTNHAAVGTGLAGTGLAANNVAGTLHNDASLVRHEEHLLVGKEKVNVGQAALHKYVTTEHVATAVPIIRERAVVEREPITELNRGSALADGAFKEAHFAVNLMEERAVAEKEAVAVERVRLRKEAEQTQQYVEADLRKEHIEIVDGTQGKALHTAGVGAAAVGAAKALESHHHNTQLGHNSALNSTTTDASRRL